MYESMKFDVYLIIEMKEKRKDLFRKIKIQFDSL